MDLVVAADVVWLDELVAPLAQYLRACLDRKGSRHAGACWSMCLGVIAPCVGGLGGTQISG